MTDKKRQSRQEGHVKCNVCMKEVPASEARSEEAMSSNNGVMHAQFNERLSHELNVSYDPDAISADEMRHQLRDWDKDVKIINL